MNIATATSNERNPILSSKGLRKSLQLSTSGQTFLYVSINRNDQKRFSQNLSAVFCADHLKQAKRLMVLLHKLNRLPDTILLDLPFNEKEVLDFVLWLHANKWSYAIPIVFERKRLNRQEVERLGQLNVTDAILNLEVLFDKDETS